MITFLYGKDGDARVKKILEHACAHPFTYAQLLDRLAAHQPLVAFDESFSTVFGNVRFCFTIEEMRPGQLYRHMSVSITDEYYDERGQPTGVRPADAPKELPPLVIVRALMRLSGFKGLLRDEQEDTEVVGFRTPGELHVLNIVEPYEC